jgi:hypothetical protein
MEANLQNTVAIAGLGRLVDRTFRAIDFNEIFAISSARPSEASARLSLHARLPALPGEF